MTEKREIIVHCPTEELWSKVFDKMKSEGRKVTIDKEDYCQECLCSLKEDDYEIYQGYISDFTKYNLPIISAQEYLREKKQLTCSELLGYIKEHGPTKARTVDEGDISEGVWEIKNWGGKEGVGLNNLPWYYNNEYKGKFELIEEEPFEDKSASEQGINTSRYFTVIDRKNNSYSEYEVGDLLKFESGSDHMPVFIRLSDKNARFEFWCNLRYATQSEIDKALGNKVEDIPEEELNGYPKIKTREDYDIAKMTYSTYIGYASCAQLEEKTNQSIIKKTKEKIMQDIKNIGLELLKVLPGFMKTQYQAGYRDERMNLTAKGIEKLHELLADEKQESLTAAAQALIDEAKKEEKK